jgi:predicted enzyme related to lactoylglutathione lyase
MKRMMLLILIAAVATGAGPVAQVTPQMPADVGAGRAAWFDITTTSMPKAKEFYGKLFDWTFTAIAGTDLAVEINSRGAGIGTLRRSEGPISGFNGVVYIQVDDVESAGKKASELGGSVVKGFPFNLDTRAGAISLILDPSGHPLGLYSRTRLAGKKP